MKKVLFRKFFILLSKSSYIAWVQFFIIGCIMLWIVNVYAFALVIKNNEWCPFTNSIYAITVFIFITSGLLILMEKPGIYTIIARYKGIQISEETGKYYKDLLLVHMRNNKPYLDPDITLAKISKDLSVKERLLSQIINDLFKMNFKSFVNHFRLQESMVKLSDPENKKKTILEILYDAGFNSKSAFNTRFKQYTGMTPQEFKQLSQKDN
jgi:AraC-like DNA-binding protein